MDNRRFFVFFRFMGSSDRKRVTPASLAIDAVLVVGFFSFMFTVLRSHVQSRDPFYITIWAGLTAGCMSGVFWLAVQMFRVVFRFQHASKK